jgi:predicted Rossmann fold flavoprotein
MQGKIGMNRVVIAGGGAAGFFAAITCAEANPAAEVTILEKGPEFLQKVRISGGGRCNVTHACFDIREFTQRYPRGQKELIGPFHQFQAADTVRWFESRGVKLKAEADGRMFPITDSSQTIIECLKGAANAAGVRLRCNSEINAVRSENGEFLLMLAGGETIACDRLLLATGGCRTPALCSIPASLGHSIEAPVPSLFTFHVADDWAKGLAGVTVPSVQAVVADAKLAEIGPLLLTHWGLSGPVILRLSAWGARELHARNYEFVVSLNWLNASREAATNLLLEHGRVNAAKLASNSALPGIPIRLWTELLRLAGISRETRWSALAHSKPRALIDVLTWTELRVTGKSLNKDEFVTCGGVRLSEINFKTMESKLCPGLYFAGELLDIDGITGGFNFQAAWTTGWIAGNAMARAL